LFPNQTGLPWYAGFGFSGAARQAEPAVPSMNPAILLASLLLVSGSQEKKCSRYGELLYRYARLDTVAEGMLIESRKIVDRLPPKCAAVEVVTNVNGKQVHAGSVTYLYGRICQKCPSPKAVDFFLAYRLANWQSADEEFSLSLERVFVSKPGVMLSRIRQQPDSVRHQLLNDIIWGFLTNRTYGPRDPYEDRTKQLDDERDRVPKEVLNKNNYETIFYNLNRNMKELSQKYAREIGYVLRETQKYLQTWGSEY
jgi:hypothetical protein